MADDPRLSWLPRILVSYAPIGFGAFEYYDYGMPEDRESEEVARGAEFTRQKALLDELSSRVPEAIVLIDADDRILQVNARADSHGVVSGAWRRRW